MGDFTGGALVFDDGTRIEEKYTWHHIDGRVYHWNEPHEGTKYSIIIYKSSKKSKSMRMVEKKRWLRANTTEATNSFRILICRYKMRILELFAGTGSVG